jgi:hypothetical protein
MMHLAAIWRYPIKSMRGESLDAASLTTEGIDGDRAVQVFDGRGRLITSRTQPALLGHLGAVGADGQPTVDGHHWRAAEARALIEEAIGLARHSRSTSSGVSTFCLFSSRPTARSTPSAGIRGACDRT